MTEPDPALKQLQAQVVAYSQGTYRAEHFAAPACGGCGNAVFRVLMNENEGVAARTCVACDVEQGIGDSDDFFADVDEVWPLTCTCGAQAFRLLAGVALYTGSDDVRWFYLGAACVSCGLSGVYGDWKNEFPDYRAFLARV